ncbi:unnamed protein product, partial [Gadus morhua 'NCC']
MERESDRSLTVSLRFQPRGPASRTSSAARTTAVWPGRWKCDYDNDCGDNSDEEQCVPRPCSESEFSCSNGRCIAGRWKCDGDHDCADGSDEHNCVVRCDSDQFQCRSGHCIPIRWRCDTDPDCMDSSDEQKCDNS